jgi:riboflavin synthase
MRSAGTSIKGMSTQSAPFAAVDDGGFAVALIPHTLEATTLGCLRPRDRVNLEVDVLAKYVEKLLPG